MIDPQAEALRAAYNGGPPLNEVGVEQARRWLAEARASRPHLTPVARVEDATTGRVAVRLYHPKPRADVPALVFAHGGGFVLGSLETADETCRRLARASECAVVSVEYRLAPEARHPAPVDDLLEVLRWLPEVAERFDVDVRRIGVAGESSGAHIALAAALSAPKRLDYALAAQLLVCPTLDRRMASDSWRRLGDDYVPRRAQMAWMWDLYLGEHDEHLAGAQDLATAELPGAPPTVLVVAEYDPLRDEGLELARRLERAGGEVVLVDCAGQIHPVFANAPAIEASDRDLKRAAAALSAILHPSSGRH